MSKWSSTPSWVKTMYSEGKKSTAYKSLFVNSTNDFSRAFIIWGFFYNGTRNIYKKTFRLKVQHLVGIRCFSIKVVKIFSSQNCCARQKKNCRDMFYSYGVRKQATFKLKVLSWLFTEIWSYAWFAQYL